MTDDIAKILPIVWGGLSFPIENLVTEISHDLQQHKFVNRNGANVENTGRNPIQVSGKAVFYNHIYPGPGETWKHGYLFPFQFNQFIDLCSQTGAYDLQHPTLGRTIKVQLQSCRIDLSSQIRGGVTVDVSWIETNENVESLLDSTSSTLISYESDASDLDQDEYIDSILANLAAEKTISQKSALTSFTDLAKSIRRNVDKTTLGAKKALGKIDAFKYQTQQVIDSLDRSKDVLTTETRIKAERAKYDMIKLAETLNTTTKEVHYYPVADYRTTLSAVCVRVGNSISQLLELNPDLAGTVIIPISTQVRYYAIIG